MTNDTTVLPTYTPWGPPQGAPGRLAEGIYSYTTASHGGIWLSPARNLEVPTCLRAVRFGSPALDSGWYEEDCDWSIVGVTFPEAFTVGVAKAARAIYQGYIMPKLASVPYGWLIADTATEATEVARIVLEG